MTARRRPEATLDAEIYIDYSLFMFKRHDIGQVLYFEAFPGQPLDRQGLAYTLSQLTCYTFNGRNYDIPIVIAALAGATPEQLKQCSNYIIQTQPRVVGWQFLKKLNLRIPDWIDYVDLQEVLPGMVSLKLYGGRMHCRKMQDLPIEHTASIMPHQRPVLRAYCENDNDITWLAKLKFAPQLEIREKMSIEYGVDLRSKSDAQIAEAVIGARVTQALGYLPKKPGATTGAIRYQPPAFMRAASDYVMPIVYRMANSLFMVGDNGEPVAPPEIKNQIVRIGQGDYRIGIGGLHSCEKSVFHKADDNTLLLDVDVASFYPAIIIKTGLFPKHLGEAFTIVYNAIFNERLTAKELAKESKTADPVMRARFKTVAETLKIVLNGSFGKFGNVFSLLFSPDLMLQVTLTGQLSLMMLIERIELWSEWAGSQTHVVSANTDGIVIKCPKGRYDTLRQIIKNWELQTGFTTEETRYKALYSRDVNNYIAVKEKGGFKLKGEYAPPEPVASSWPSPHNQVCVDAVCWHLAYGFNIEEWILNCKDVRQFVEIRTVKGGAKWNDQPIGKAVRWYKSTNGMPMYSMVGHHKTGTFGKVADTDGCRPMMELTDTIPRDLDYDWYIEEAHRILLNIGVTTNRQ